MRLFGNLYFHWLGNKYVKRSAKTYWCDVKCFLTSRYPRVDQSLNETSPDLEASSNKSSLDVNIQCDQIWQNFTNLAKFINLCQMVEGLFCFWITIRTYFGKIFVFGATFLRCTWPNIENNKAIWSHCPHHNDDRFDYFDTKFWALESGNENSSSRRVYFFHSK